MKINREIVLAKFGENRAFAAYISSISVRMRRLAVSKKADVENVLESFGLPRYMAVGVLHDLEECGCGVYRKGRSGKHNPTETRLEWTVDSTLLSEIIQSNNLSANDSESDDDLSKAEAPVQGASDDIEHVYVLRKDARVVLRLPNNLTKSEADRLASFIQTLPLE